MIPYELEIGAHFRWKLDRARRSSSARGLSVNVGWSMGSAERFTVHIRMGRIEVHESITSMEICAASGPAGHIIALVEGFIDRVKTAGETLLMARHGVLCAVAGQPMLYLRPWKRSRTRPDWREPKWRKFA